MVNLDPALFIEAVEAEVVELYRSSSPVSLPVEGPPGPEALAVASVLRRENRYFIHAALYVKNFRRALVYAVDAQPGGLANPAGARKKACRFLESMGFTPEPVNLKYSPAMREVILRQVPVILPAAEVRKLQDERTRELALLQEKVAEAAPEVDTAEPDAEPQRAAEARAEARSAASRLAALKRIADQEEALMRAVEPFLAQINAAEAQGAEIAERDRLTKELAAATERIAGLEKSLRQAEQQRRKIQADKEALQKEVASLEERQGEIRQELQRTQERVAVAGREKDTLESGLAEATALAAGLEERLRRAEDEAAAGRRQQAELLAAREKDASALADLRRAVQQAEERLAALAAAREESASALERRAADLEGQLDLARRQLAAAGAERERLEQSLAADRARLDELGRALREAETAAAATAGAAPVEDGTIAELEERLRRLTAEAGADRAERDRLRQDREADRRRLQELQDALDAAAAPAETDAAGRAGLAAEAERWRAQAEGAQRDREALERARAADRVRLEELERRLEAAGYQAPAPAAEDVRQLRDALRQAEERAEFLRQEVERLAAAKAMAEAKAAGSSPPAAAPGGKLPAPQNRLGALMLEKTDPGPPPHVVRRPPPPGAPFHVDWDLSGVPCPSLSDLCEIHQSVGMVQLALEGYPNQYCSGFIVVLNAGDRKKVFLPFRLSASGRTLVYVPARQPENPAALARTVKEAVRFLQVVGMDTERVPFNRQNPKVSPDLRPVLDLEGGKMAGNF